MADNWYVYESILTGGDIQDSDGTDWLVISGNYSAETSGNSCWIVLSNYAYNVSPPPGDFAFAFTVPNSFWTAVKIYGQIENALGGAGTETMIGGDIANFMQGDPDDVAGGDDQISSKGGNDTLVGMGGSDDLSGGSGNDLIFGDNDPFAQGGNIAHGNDWLFGDTGDDTLFGGWGQDSIYGGDGNDLADYSGFFDDYGYYAYRVIIDSGLNTAQVYAIDLYDGTEWLAKSDSFGSLERYRGSGGDDLFIEKTFHYPGDLANSFLGGYGNDTYYMRTTSTSVVEAAGQGRDRIVGFTQGDLAANVEDLTMTLGSYQQADAAGNVLGNDIQGNDLANLILGRAGNDTLRGAGANDRLQGQDGNDSLLGEAGRDRLAGGTGQDVVLGGDQADELSGDGGNDTLSGGTGQDTLNGGAGADVLTGDSGGDVFVFARASDVALTAKGRALEVVTDFATGQDVLDISGIQVGQSFITTRFTGQAGEVRFSAASGQLMGDLDGDQLADWAVALTGVTGLSAADLLL